MMIKSESSKQQILIDTLVKMHPLRYTRSHYCPYRKWVSWLSRMDTSKPKLMIISLHYHAISSYL